MNLDHCLPHESWVVGLSQGTLPAAPAYGAARLVVPSGGAESACAGPARSHRAYSAFGDASLAARPVCTERLPQGCLKDLPSIDMVSGASSSAARSVARPRSASARSSQLRTCSVLAVSHRLDGLRHPRLAGVLQPATDPGVHRFSALARPQYCGRRSASHPGALTLQSLPLLDSGSHVTVGPAPSSFAERFRAVRPRGFLPSGSPLRVRVVADSLRPMLSWASLLWSAGDSDAVRRQTVLPEGRQPLAGRTPRRVTIDVDLRTVPREGPGTAR